MATTTRVLKHVLFANDCKALTIHGERKPIYGYGISKGVEGPKLKSHGNSRGWGEYREAPCNRKAFGGAGVKLEKKNLCGEYEYFLEPQTECS